MAQAKHDKKNGLMLLEDRGTVPEKDMLADLSVWNGQEPLPATGSGFFDDVCCLG
jgi:hypothetical protein